MIESDKIESFDVILIEEICETSYLMFEYI